MNHDPSRDFKPMEDLFEPVSKPDDAYIRLPKEVNVEFIATEKDIDKLRVLVGKNYIGVDSEWRVQMHKWHKVGGPATLQLSAGNNAFIVDLIALGNNKQFDRAMGNIFSNKLSTIVGFGFDADLNQFKKYLPNQTFYKNIANFIDA